MPQQDTTIAERLLDARPTDGSGAAGAGLTARKICLISDACLSPTHGTGAQMLRLFDDQGLDFHHFYLHLIHEDTRRHPCSTALADRTWRWRLGARFILRMRKKLGLTWWPGGSIDRARFDGVVRRFAIRPDVAYVVISSEESAEKAAEILGLLGCPYVLHIMDMHERPAPETMPKFRRLLSGAAAILAITPTLCDEIARCGRSDAQIMPIGQDVTSQIAHAPQEGERLRLVTIGKPYGEGVSLLEDALPALNRRVPNLELLYVGAYFQNLPPGLQRAMKNCGLVPDQEYNRLLASCHLAYLSGPAVLDNPGRFSFPSRSADYMMAGLPILACVAEGSATEKMLLPLSPKSIQFTKTPGDIVAAVEDFTASADRWQAASDAARSYAESEMAIDPIRRRIFRILEAACASPAFRQKAEST